MIVKTLRADFRIRKTTLRGFVNPLRIDAFVFQFKNNIVLQQLVFRGFLNSLRDFRRSRFFEFAEFEKSGFVNYLKMECLAKPLICRILPNAGLRWQYIVGLLGFVRRCLHFGVCDHRESGPTSVISLESTAADGLLRSFCSHFALL